MAIYDKLLFVIGTSPDLQGVVAGSRVYHQRRRSGFPGDTWPDQHAYLKFPSFSSMATGYTQQYSVTCL